MGADVVPATVDASVLSSARPSMPLSSPQLAGECSKGMEERGADAASPASNQVPRMAASGIATHTLAEAPLGPAAQSDTFHGVPRRFHPGLRMRHARRIWRKGSLLPGHGRWALVDGSLRCVHAGQCPLQAEEAQRSQRIAMRRERKVCLHRRLIAEYEATMAGAREDPIGSQAVLEAMVVGPDQQLARVGRLERALVIVDG